MCVCSLEVILKIRMTSGSRVEIRSPGVKRERRGEVEVGLIRDVLCGITAAEEAD